jgi:hypothetical protein
MRRVLCAVAHVALMMASPVSSAVQKPQIAELNHVFATVDPQTAEVIRKSEFLRRFANVEIRTTTGTPFDLDGSLSLRKADLHRVLRSQ